MAERSSRSGKKIVKAESVPDVASTTSKTQKEVREEADRRVREGTGWRATPEAKGKAKTLRIIAAILWAVAIVLEAVGIWYILTQDVRTDWFLWALLGLLVVIGILTIIGSQLWKKANDHDPASRQEPVRYFVQNQLGAIIPVIAFLPIIIVLLLSKNVDPRTKGIAGAVGGVLLVAAVLLGWDWNPESQESRTEEEIVNEGQIDEYTAIVEQLTGKNEVAWTPAGDVYHLCTDASAVNQQSAANEIRVGTVADAHADGKEGLTLQVDAELDQCGLPEPENLDEIEAEIRELREEFEAENAG